MANSGSSLILVMVLLWGLLKESWWILMVAYKVMFYDQVKSSIDFILFSFLINWKLIYLPMWVGGRVIDLMGEL